MSWCNFCRLIDLPICFISFTLNSKPFSFNNPFLLSLLHQLLSVLWLLDLANGFHLTVIFTLSVHFHLVHLRQCLWISLLKLSLLCRLYIYRHSKSPPLSFTQNLRAIIIIRPIICKPSSKPNLTTIGSRFRYPSAIQCYEAWASSISIKQ